MIKNNCVILIAFEEFDNLGVRYPAAVLEQAGFSTAILNVQLSNTEIYNFISRHHPVLVGFSVVYQYNIRRFIGLVSYLRKRKINCHFTAGGHYASLKYEELFSFIPGLDSVVRFEGEYTLLELVKSVSSDTDWRKTLGIAFKSANEISCNKLRPFEKDLDRFPYPVRPEPRDYALHKKYATIIAGRGCTNDCSFCNSREFYTRSSGPRKRQRKPEMVVDEMEFLSREKGCSVFLFQDDDFPVSTFRSSDWIIRFCNELKNRGLHKEIMWKINCRPDEVEMNTFTLMKESGLYLVFLGIDDGTNTGLSWINKHMTVERSLQGIETLKELNIGFDFGFMLFQPLTTFRSLYTNLAFLKTICGDGYTPVTFLKMMPYYETSVEKFLIAEGRLKGDPGFRDYDFIEDSMNRYFDFISSSFMEWLNYRDGLVSIAKWARNYISVFRKYVSSGEQSQELANELSGIISESNLFLLEMLNESADAFASQNARLTGQKKLAGYKKRIDYHHEFYKKAVRNMMVRLFRLVYKFNAFYLS